MSELADLQGRTERHRSTRLTSNGTTSSAPRSPTDRWTVTYLSGAQGSTAFGDGDRLGVSRDGVVAEVIDLAVLET